MSGKKAREAEEWLGESCRDKATGFYGIATGVAFYMGTEPKILIESPTPTGDAKTRWVDAARVEQTTGDEPPGVYA